MKIYLQKFVFVQNWAKLQNIEPSKILGYTVFSIKTSTSLQALLCKSLGTLNNQLPRPKYVH